MTGDDTWLIDDDDRYSRFRLIAWWDQTRLAAARVLVVGAGALGNEVLKNLALLGVGHVYLIDFDTIENTNLTRSVLFRARDRGRSKAEAAAAALHDLNPDTRVYPLVGDVTTDLGLGVFRDVDVVIGCLDNREARLWVNRCCWKVGTPWIDGGIQEINGVAKVFVPPDSACYECAMTETDYRLINLRYSCPLLRQDDLLAGRVPTAPTIASMIGGLQTQEALKLIHQMPVAAGEALVYNGLSNQFYRTRFQRRDDCLSHEVYPPPAEVAVSSQQSCRDLFAALGCGQDPTAQLVLERDLVVRLNCPGCDRQEEVMRPASRVSVQQLNCPACGESRVPERTHVIAGDSPLARRCLSELGVPAYDIVRVTREAGELFALLAADRDPLAVFEPTP